MSHGSNTHCWTNPPQFPQMRFVEKINNDDNCKPLGIRLLEERSASWQGDFFSRWMRSLGRPVTGLWLTEEFIHRYFCFFCFIVLRGRREVRVCETRCRQSRNISSNQSQRRRCGQHITWQLNTSGESVCLSSSLPVCLFASHLTIYPSLCLSVCLPSDWAPICLVCPVLFSFLSVSICVSVFACLPLSVCLSVGLTVLLSVSMCTSVWLPVQFRHSLRLPRARNLHLTFDGPQCRFPPITISWTHTIKSRCS